MRCRIGCAWVLLGFLGVAAGSAVAQQNPPLQEPVLIPMPGVHLAPACGATPLSAQIHAESHYVNACGNMLVSAAFARKVNAEAVALEIQNSVAYVNAYFERREINRRARAKEDPNYLERQTKLQNVLKRRIEEQYQDVLRGDVTKMLNWMMRELSEPVIAYRYLPRDQRLVHSQLDQVLDPRTIADVRLTDGGPKSSQLVFSASDGKVLQASHWPIALRSQECAGARDAYDRILSDIAAEIKEKGQVSEETQTNVMQAVNGMFVALDDAYPKERRKDPGAFLEYSAAKRFLQSAVATVHRAMTTNDPKVLAGDLRFQGDSLIGLLEHMYRIGAEFAPPEPGDEGTYKALFQELRSLYLTIGPDRPAVEVFQQMDDAAPLDNDKSIR